MSKKKKDWKVEKERLGRLELEERRKEYRRSDYVTLDKIPTWRQASKESGEEEGEDIVSGGRLSDKVSLYKGDITILEVDAIVNAANSSLLGGGGVDGCIHKAAGSCLYEECNTLNGCETGNAKITCGYDLPAKYVIHTVGPVARGHVGSTETRDLTSCYENSLKLLTEHGLSTVAFPCISTGIYGFPNDPAAAIALSTVKACLEEHPDEITRVIFCVFLETDYKIYKEKMSKLFEGADSSLEETEGGEDEREGHPAAGEKKSASKDRGEEEEEEEEEEEDDDEEEEEMGRPDEDTAAEVKLGQRPSDTENDSSQDVEVQKEASQDCMDGGGEILGGPEEKGSDSSPSEVHMKAQGEDSQESDLPPADSTCAKEQAKKKE